MRGLATIAVAIVMLSAMRPGQRQFILASDGANASGQCALMPGFQAQRSWMATQAVLIQQRRKIPFEIASRSIRP
jgi:hypothetical protein